MHLKHRLGLFCLFAGQALLACGKTSPAAPVSAVAGRNGVAGLGGPGTGGSGTAQNAVSQTATGGSNAQQQAGVAGSPVAGSSVVAGQAGSALVAGAAGQPTAGASAAGSGIAGTGATTAGAMAPAEMCAGKPGKKHGMSKETVMTKPGARTFIYYAPDNLHADQPVPLLIVPHGYTQSGSDMFQITQYAKIADREGFVAMFPDGAPNSTGPWDVGANVCGNGSLVPGNGDDQGFIDAMIAFAAADQCIDRAHIFMSGWSMGGYLSHHSGCLRDDIRAIGPHSAGTHDLTACKTGHKPVIMFHFNPDGLIDYSCGTKARDAWIQHNGCDANAPDVKAVKGGKCEYYKGCPADGQVAFCTFDIPSNHKSDFLAGHAWSGGTVHAYSIAETESAAELGWTFFKTYAW
jgi:polyhydroxybutyrate depolymerase